MVSTIIRKQVLITACNNDTVYTNIFWHPRVTQVLREIFFITTLYKIFGTCLFVQSLWSTELVDGRGNLQSLHQHCSLTLESDVFGPSYKATQVTLRLNILTYNTKFMQESSEVWIKQELREMLCTWPLASWSIKIHGSNCAHFNILSCK